MRRYSTPKSQVAWSASSKDSLSKPIQGYKSATVSGGQLTYGQIFEIEDYSFDIEQTLNIGSQSGGAGAGKVTFNPFSITRKIDAASPMLFQMACAGTPFQTVYLALRKSVGAGATGGNRDHDRRLRLPALRLQAGGSQDDILEP